MIPVTQFGDPGRAFGFLFGPRDSLVRAYRPALGIDRTDWADPDYMLLAFVRDDRPGSPCANEPGEAVDRRAVAAAALPRGPVEKRLRVVRRALNELTQDVEDLAAPIDEFLLFDQCAFTIGIDQLDGSRGRGIWFGAGGTKRRSALSMTHRARTPDYRLLAFPQEEPPSIECNEDAGQEQTAQ
jgi:hypothetical protein